MTTYLVESFIDTEHGLMAEPPLCVRSAALAWQVAELLARQCPGALAWECEEDDTVRTLLFRKGRVLESPTPS